MRKRDEVTVFGGGRKAALTATLAAILAACSRAPESPAPPPHAPAAPSVAERVRVLNGDVLVVDRLDVRLANVYAPQPVPHAHCWAEALAARQVVRELRALVATAQDVQVRVTRERDEYQRPLAYVTLDRLDLGDTLYDMGLVARRGAEPFDWCAPVSNRAADAPPVRTLMEFTR